MTPKHREETITRPCELCNRDAILYCDSDSAFLCRTCDAAVHRANFLVARHLRQPLCLKCKSLAGIFFSGAAVPRDSPPLCRLCAEKNPNLKQNPNADANADASSLSSAVEEEEEEDDDCVSTTEGSAIAVAVGVNSMKTKRIDVPISSSSSVTSDGENQDVNPQAKRRTRTAADSRAEGIFVVWSRRLGLDDDNHKSVVVTSASEALAVCLERMNINTTVVLPFRVCLAASFWVGLKMCGGDVSTWQNLKKLEMVSGVPAKLIVAIERRLARVMKIRRTAKVHDLEEGWAECDV